METDVETSAPGAPGTGDAPSHAPAGATPVPAPDAPPDTPAAAAPARIPRWVTRWANRLALAGGIGLLAYVLTRFPFDKVVDACLEVGPVMLVTPLIALGWFACNTSALRVLLARRVPWRELLWNRLIGDGYNALLPLGGIGGEPWKLRHLSELVSTEDAVAALVRDRVLENSLGLIVTGTAIAITMSAYTLPGAFHTALWGYVAAAIVAGGLGLGFVVTRLPGRAGKLVEKWLGETASAPARGLAIRNFLLASLWVLAGRIVGLVEIGLLFRVLDLGVDPVAIVFVDSVLHAAGFVGFVIPQGFGVLEGTSAYLFTVLGLSGPAGIAFALARRGRMLLVSLVGIGLHPIYHLVRRKRQPAST